MHCPVTTAFSISAGPADELRALLAELAAEGAFVRELETGGVAYHSPMLQPVLAELHAGARRACSAWRAAEPVQLAARQALMRHWCLHAGPTACVLCCVRLQQRWTLVSTRQLRKSKRAQTSSA
jgi:hypothetical protein